MTPLEQYAAALPSEMPHTGGVHVRGLAVLCSGRTEFSQPAIAVWHIALSGAFTGSWVMPQAQVGEADAARLALILLERRALLAWDPEQPLAVLAGLIDAAGLLADTANPWEEHLCRVSEALSQIQRARAAHEAALKDQPNAAPLHWKLALPLTDPAALADFLPAVRRAAPHSAAPVTYNALELATVARWCLHAWQETETVRLRRPVLCQQFGPEQPAPPAWIAALRAQNSQKLKLDDETHLTRTVPLDPGPESSSSVVILG